MTDILKVLLSSAVGPDRVDVPDLNIRFPIDQGLPTFLEKYQPIVPLCVELIQKYLGGWLCKDHNAGRSSTSKEGMWRVKIAPRKSAVKPVVEFWTSPAKATISPAEGSTDPARGIIPVDPAAYPPAMDGSRPIGGPSSGKGPTTRGSSRPDATRSS